MNLSAAYMSHDNQDILPWLPMLSLFAIFFFMRQLQAGGGKVIRFGKSKARLLTDPQNRITFNYRKDQTMEKRFFTYESWDLQDTLCMMFNQCVVITPFGPYKRGDRLRFVCLDYGKGVIDVYGDNGADPLWTAQLSLAIVESE